MTIKNHEKGSVAVECAMGIPLVVLLLLVVIQFLFLCIERQLMNYTAFMAARSRMVRADGAYRKLAEQLVPWARAEEDSSDPDRVMMHVRGHKPIFNIDASPLGNHYRLISTLPVFPHAQVNRHDEDNPMICPGGHPC